MASGEMLLFRAKRVGISIAALARRAGLDKNTVQFLEAERKSGPLSRTVGKVRAEIEAEEISMADHLVGLPHIRKLLIERLRNEDAA